MNGEFENEDNILGLDSSSKWLVGRISLSEGRNTPSLGSPTLHALVRRCGVKLDEVVS